MLIFIAVYVICLLDQVNFFQTLTNTNTNPICNP